jgi:hypothetical protein
MSTRRMITSLSHARAARFAFALLLVLSCCLTASNSSSADARDKKLANGLIIISTNPGGYPIIVDGKPWGTTTSVPQEINLPPGPHTVEVVMPNGSRWLREFGVIAGRKNCIVLSYRPKTINIERSPCPYPVNISAPSSVNDGDVITFSSDTTYGGTAALSYTWTVSPASARIMSGAGTPTITVDSTGLGHQRVTAILVVDDGSGDRACHQMAQAATTILAPPPPPLQPRKFDEFPALAFDDLKARLDNLAIGLQNEPGSTASIIVYAGRRSRTDQASRLITRTRDYLVNMRHMDDSRLNIINGGTRENDYFEIWLVPQGATPPQPTPASTTPTNGAPPEPEIQVRPRTRRRG